MSDERIITITLMDGSSHSRTANEWIELARRDLKRAPSAEAVASRDEIIERALTQFAQCISVLAGQDMTRHEIMVEESRPKLQAALRVLKERAAPQGSTGTAPDKSPGEGPAVAAPVDPFDATFDCHYGGDINRCDKDCKQLGACKRRTSTPSPIARPSTVEALRRLLACIDDCKGHGTPIIKDRAECYAAMAEAEQELQRAPSTGAVDSAPMPASDFRLMSEQEKYGAYAMAYRRVGQLERELAALGKDYERLLKESTEELKAARSSKERGKTMMTCPDCGWRAAVPDGWLTPSAKGTP